jgi:predicted AAA+ superfamily ATPase
MEAAEISNIVQYWSFWNKPIPESIPRDVELPASLNRQMPLVVQGVRRCGKSTLLTQLIGHYKLEASRCFFINFEDPRLITSLNTEFLEEVLRYFRSQHDEDTALYFFFDEIQNVQAWHKWIFSKIERPENNYFILTGSSSTLLSAEIGSTLTGRHQSITLYPFSFQEYVRSTLDNSPSNYLRLGGFPAAFQSLEPEEVLRELFTDIIERDIVTRLGISNPRTLKQLAKIIFESSGSESSFRKLAGSTGLSADTVGSYLAHCESAYLFLECPFFSFSEKQRTRRNSKYYPIDPALRRAVITRSGEDLGKDFELLVFLSLKRIFTEVCYWKDKGELDFVVQTKQGILPIQVSLDEPKEGHYQALEEFYERFPNAREAIYCTMDSFSEVIPRLSADES